MSDDGTDLTYLGPRDPLLPDGVYINGKRHSLRIGPYERDAIASGVRFTIEANKTTCEARVRLDLRLPTFKTSQAALVRMVCEHGDK